MQSKATTSAQPAAEQYTQSWMTTVCTTWDAHTVVYAMVWEHLSMVSLLNRRKSYLNEEAREILHLTEVGFAIVSNQDGAIVHTAENMKEVIECLQLIGDDKSYGIYLHIDGTLQYLGCTYLVWLIQQALND